MWNWTDAVSALAQAALAAGALIAGGWALYTYRKAKMAEVARWQKQIFDHLFLSGKYDAVREALELVNYDMGLGRKVELSIIEHVSQKRSGHLTDKDRELLLEMNNFLNLIEYVLYLEQDKKQIDAKDREALLGYYVNTIKDKRRSALRYYVSQYGYEKITGLIGASGDTLLVLYGSLRRDQPKFGELRLGQALEFLGPCRFEGELFDLGGFPGAVPGSGEVHGEMFKVCDPCIFAVLDEYEEFDISRPEESLFVRRCIHVEGFGDAWVYLYHGGRANCRRVLSGDWLSRQLPAE